MLSPAVVADIFRTCCALHNYLLRWDHLDEPWGQGRGWNGPLGDYDVDEDRANAPQEDFFGHGAPPGVEAALDVSVVGAVSVVEEEASYYQLRKDLVTHIAYHHAKKNLVWPSRT